MMIINRSSIIIFMALGVCASFAKDSVPLSATHSVTEVIQLSSQSIKNDILGVLNAYKSDSAEEVVLIERLKQRISQEKTVLSSAEAKQTVTILERFAASKAGHTLANKERLLVALGDHYAISHAVSDLAAASSLQRRKAKSRLLGSGQPRVVAALAEHLFLDEDVRPLRLGEDVFSEPSSVAATRIAVSILCESGQFPPDVKAWASKLRQSQIRHRRDLVRQWWTVNQLALNEGRFSDTRLLHDASLADDYKSVSVEQHSVISPSLASQQKALDAVIEPVQVFPEIELLSTSSEEVPSTVPKATFCDICLIISVLFAVIVLVVVAILTKKHCRNRVFRGHPLK